MYDFTIYSTECNQIKLLLRRHVRYIRILFYNWFYKLLHLFRLCNFTMFIHEQSSDEIMVSYQLNLIKVFTSFCLIHFQYAFNFPVN